ncbi:MAG: glycosyltransferase family 2 protein [Deltaproteobacteria bacterium]|nr:glycosyltransferase family 2 protein [Deltaproteobacteria bacterium]
MTPPFVSIAVPCLNEERYVEACLAALRAQDYPAERLEILVADGGSTDRTREILQTIVREDPRVRVVDNPGRIQAAGLNEAIRRARGDVVIRADVHADYAPDYVRRCVEVLDETGAWNVGGAARPRAKGPFQAAVCAALKSPLSFGGSKYRDERNEGWVESVFPGAFRREVFEEVGLFDPKAITNEDAEINQRIWAHGGRVWLSPKIVVHYYPRDSFGGLARQYFKYGVGRARTLLKHGRFLSVRPAVPFLALTGELVLAIAAPPVAAIAASAYALVTLVEAVRVAHGEGFRAVPVVWAIFPVLHVSHAIGFASGLVRYALSPDWPRAAPA